MTIPRGTARAGTWRKGRTPARESGKICRVSVALGSQLHGRQPDGSIRDVRYGLVGLLRGNDQFVPRR